MIFPSRSARSLAPALFPSFLFATAIAAQAQSVPTLSPVVVTASRTEQQLQDALPATTVITRDDIARSHASDLPTLLDTVAGVQLAQTGGIGQPASVFMRGGNSNDTLVLIDGVPINNLTAGTASLEHIALSDIDHIEIVRGNVSAIYGSAALGGVIQIFTREAGAKPQLSISGQIGSYGLKQTDANGSVRLASGTSLAASAETINYKGFPAVDANQVPGALSVDDGTTRRALGFSLRQDLGGGNSVGLRLRDSRGTVQYDPLMSPDTRTFMTRYALGGAVLDGLFQLRPQWKLTAALTHSADKWDDTADHAGYFNSTSDGANAGLEWTFAQQQKLTGGVETTRQSVQSATLFTQTARTQNSLRLGYLGKFGDRAQHQLQINLRSDHYSDFGNANTGYLGYAYWLSESWRVKVSYSTGFNAPTFNQLYYPGFSNPNLQPERLKSGEMGLEWAANGQQFRAVLFRNDYSDLIALNSQFVPYNIGRARIDGVEFSYQGRFGATRLHADLTLQDPKDLATGNQLVRRARTLAHLGASRDIGAWTVGGELRYASSSPDSAYNVNTFMVTPATIPAYTVAVLTAGYRVDPEWTLFARLDNLFDSKYQTAYGYNQPGRGIYVGLRWQPTLR
ncbi:MAG: Outer membrane vitamin B12 receptor BtuB [Burkholderiaceae bacterium]|jgi:vitamin B12 transporter|nr:MAG: Outer membrane vitamin B12 receptor BtuB [Burkholderiaceae bacterium]